MDKIQVSENLKQHSYFTQKKCQLPEKSVSVSFFCCWRCAQDRTIWFHGWPTKFVWPIKCPSLCFSGRLHTVVKNEHEFAEVVLLMKPHCLQQQRSRQRPGSVPWLFPMCSIGIRAVLNYFVCVFGSRGCQAAANSKLRHFSAFCYRLPVVTSHDHWPGQISAQ